MFKPGRNNEKAIINSALAGGGRELSNKIEGGWDGRRELLRGMYQNQDIWTRV